MAVEVGIEDLYAMKVITYQALQSEEGSAGDSIHAVGVNLVASTEGPHKTAFKDVNTYKDGSWFINSATKVLRWHSHLLGAWYQVVGILNPETALKMAAEMHHQVEKSSVWVACGLTVTRKGPKPFPLPPFLERETTFGSVS
jgi:hypothetical protein